MSFTNLSYRIFPLGDTAITIEFGSAINSSINKKVVARFQQLQQQPFPGMIEIIPAYCTLTVLYDIGKVKKEYPTGSSAFETVKKIIEEQLAQPVEHINVGEHLVKIPVCYAEEFAWDIPQVAAKNNLTVEEVITLHQSIKYKVYMLGFLPGFAYMGEVDEKITMPRKTEPVPIAAGSVGIAGVQTGIYPFASPGGWQIIGRTPLKLFNVGRDEPVLLKAGDTVQFHAISIDEFHQQENDSLF